MLYTLKNSLHNTTTTVRLAPGAKMTARQIKSAERKLCGIKGCRCSDDFLGTRGPQEVRIKEHVAERWDGPMSITYSLEREPPSRWGNRGPERKRLDGLEHELRPLGEQLAAERDLERRP